MYWISPNLNYGPTHNTCNRNYITINVVPCGCGVNKVPPPPTEL